MTSDLIGPIILWLIIAIFLIAVIASFFSWLYHRTTKEVAFVRTGMGGETVVINGGAMVLPVVHEITPVSLNVVRVQVQRIREQAIISRDRLRIDIKAEFFVRVIQEPAAVAAAASTLGRKTLEPDGFNDLLSGKFISALRSVAAEMSLDEMHENLAAYVARVEERAAEALAQNGLELESVAITDLDQTDLEYFKPANRFDAEGLTQLVETIETRRKMRNDIEQSSVVAIRARNLEAEQETLKLEQLSEGSRLNQERELEIMRAEQRAEITRSRSSNEAQAESARIQNEQATRELEIARQRTVQESEIKAQEEIEKARIVQQQTLESSRIASDARLQQARSENQIAVLQKQSEEAKTRIETEGLHAMVVAAEEAVVTLRETVIAERTATVDKLLAEKDADNARTAAEAGKVTAAVASEAERLSNEAENILSDDARAARLRALMINRLEGIVRQSVKPMKNIEGIKILHVDGLGGNSGSTRSPTDEVIESALRYRAQAPLIDEMLKEIGVDNPGVSRMGDIFRSARDVQSIARDNQKKDNKDD